MRKIVTKIEFEFDEDQLQLDPENTMTDEELLQHAAELFVDDIFSLVKHNQLYEVALARTAFVDDQSSLTNNFVMSPPDDRIKPGT